MLGRKSRYWDKWATTHPPQLIAKSLTTCHSSVSPTRDRPFGRVSTKGRLLTRFEIRLGSRENRRNLCDTRRCPRIRRRRKARAAPAASICIGSSRQPLALLLAVDSNNSAVIGHSSSFGGRSFRCSQGLLDRERDRLPAGALRATVGIGTGYRTRPTRAKNKSRPLFFPRLRSGTGKLFWLGRLLLSSNLQPVALREHLWTLSQF